jgi:drug/metabolite transporter (DMT)-like permease
MFSKADIEKYFIAEKSAGGLFITIGLIAIVIAIIFFFFLKTDFYKGTSIPLIVIGLLSGIVGYTVYAKSDSDRMQNVYAFDMNPSELKQKEIPRMQNVKKSFKIILWVELILAAAGMGLYIYFIRDIRYDFWRGLGLGLAIMALIALAMDYFADKRARTYLNGLNSFTSNNS